MPTYTPPLRDMHFLLNELLQVPQALQELPAHAETDADTITADNTFFMISFFWNGKS